MARSILFTNFLFISSFNNVLKVGGVHDAAPSRLARGYMCKNNLGSLFKIKFGHGVQTNHFSVLNVMDGLSFLERGLLLFHGK